MSNQSEQMILRGPDTASLAEKAQLSKTFLLDLNNQIRLPEDPLAVMAKVIEMLGLWLKAARAGYAAVDAQEETITVERDWADGTVQTAAGAYPLAVFGNPAVSVLKAGETFVVGDVDEDPRLSPDARAVFHSVNTRALVVVPLVKNGKFTAVLFVHQATARHWSPEDVSLIKEVAERTWSAVESARVGQP